MIWNVVCRSNAPIYKNDTRTWILQIEPCDQRPVACHDVRRMCARARYSVILPMACSQTRSDSSMWVWFGVYVCVCVCMCACVYYNNMR